MKTKRLFLSTGKYVMVMGVIQSHNPEPVLRAVKMADLSMWINMIIFCLFEVSFRGWFYCTFKCMNVISLDDKTLNQEAFANNYFVCGKIHTIFVMS